MDNTNRNAQKDKYLKIAIIITAVVTALSFVVFCVALIAGIIEDNKFDDPGYDYGDGMGDDKDDKDTEKPNVQGSVGKSEPGSKTGIVLPSATLDGSYLGTTADTVDMSGESVIKSAAAAIVDITNNKTVAGKNADTKIYPASMTKVMTLLVAVENARDPNELLTVTDEMVAKYAKPENHGASVTFEWKSGDKVTVEDALQMVIYKSDTYACWLLTEYVAGGEQEFVALMNAKARELGLSSTNFTNCTGLFNTNHYTTCREFAAVMAAAMNNEAAYNILTRTSKFTVTVYKDGEEDRSVDMYSDWFSGRLEKYREGAAAAQYAGNGSDVKFLAGKTGYETVPTNCFVTAAYNDVTGTKYVCVQVGRIDESQEKITPQQSTMDTRRIYQKYGKE